MKIEGKSIRAFIGAKNFTISRDFYTYLGFIEITISPIMSYFYKGEFGFYLQDANNQKKYCYPKNKYGIRS